MNLQESIRKDLDRLAKLNEAEVTTSFDQKGAQIQKLVDLVKKAEIMIPNRKIGDQYWPEEDGMIWLDAVSQEDIAKGEFTGEAELSGETIRLRFDQIDLQYDKFYYLNDWDIDFIEHDSEDIAFALFSEQRTFKSGRALYFVPRGEERQWIDSHVPEKKIFVTKPYTQDYKETKISYANMDLENNKKYEFSSSDIPGDLSDVDGFVYPGDKFLVPVEIQISMPTAKVTSSEN